MLVVVIIIGILSAIAAPTWLAFTNRQRINKVNDVVLSTLQEAQREAKKLKLIKVFGFVSKVTI
ncbi:MAG: type II secretion system protein [Methylacidiphilales bacterium]|nr:type II secretion system protein [Candidatus Methylacidiphilales bacterium]